jgi:hypothetical protein
VKPVILDEQVEVKWSNRTKTWFESKGYNYTQLGDSFLVSVSDLPDNSAVLLNVSCDFCGSTFTRKYKDISNEVSCKQCVGKHSAKTKKESAIEYNQENIDIEDDVCYLKLPNGTTVLFDYTDLFKVVHYRWFENELGYIMTNVRGPKSSRQVAMHKIITNTDKTQSIEHINRRKNDNRRSNLRYSTAQQEDVSTLPKQVKVSKYKGVGFHSRANHWYARIKYKGKLIRIGTFISEVASANAYNYFAKALYGGHAYLNDVPSMDLDEWDSHRTSRKPIQEVLDEAGIS